MSESEKGKQITLTYWDDQYEFTKEQAEHFFLKTKKAYPGKFVDLRNETKGKGNEQSAGEERASY